mgnify:CR=1 FL=1
MKQVKVKPTVRYASEKEREKVRRMHEANRVDNLAQGGRKVRRLKGIRR